MPARPAADPGERLQKVLAHAGLASRRKCEEYIVAGRVKVNGKTITELGTRVHPDRDIVEVDGQPVVAQERKLLYFLLYKPVGYLSTVSDSHGRQTALSLVPSEERLYPVGRLDLNSEGLLLFSNDGELAYRLMHPRFKHEREYYVLVAGQVPNEELVHMRQGVQVEVEGQPHLLHARVNRLPPEYRWRKDLTPAGGVWLRVLLHEGHKRQIRLMLAALGHDLLRLIRVRFGALTLGDLAPGKGRWLSREEARELRRATGLDGGPPRPTEPTRGRKSLEKNTRRDRRPRRVGQEHPRRKPRP